MGGGEPKKSGGEPKKSGGEPKKSGGGQYLTINGCFVISLMQSDCRNPFLLSIRGEKEGSQEGNRIGSH